MKIVDIQHVPVTARWVSDPGFPQSLHSSSLLRVTTDAGIDGWGEATVGYFAAEIVGPIVDYFRPVLVGKSPMDIVALESAMLSDAMWWARSGAGRSVLSGIEMALWDIKGKALNVPAYQLMGGLARTRVPVYASGGPSMWPVDENRRKVEFYQSLGHVMVKLSTGLYEWSAADTTGAQGRLRHADVPYVARIDALVKALDLIRRDAGPSLDLAIDGHQGGVPHPIAVTDAIAFADAVAPFRLRFYEEPLSYREPDSYATLAARSRTPIAGGESLCGVDAFHALLARGGLHVAQPDVGFVGGVLETLRVIRHAAGFNATTALHTGASIGPCLAASWHLAAACPEVAWLEVVESSRAARERFLADHMTIHDGTIAPPEQPGLGLHITNELLNDFPFIAGSGERT